jgi:hypothetical protein
MTTIIEVPDWVVRTFAAVGVLTTLTFVGICALAVVAKVTARHKARKAPTASPFTDSRLGWRKPA